MKRYVPLFALLLILAASAAAWKWLPRRAAIQIGDAKLDAVFAQKGFKLKRPLNGAEYVLINFWASWCPPCVAEMPSMIRFLTIHKQFLFLSISQDSSQKELSDFLKAFPSLEPTTAALFMDYDQSLGRVYHVEKLPETFVYNLKQHKTLQISGSMDWDQPDVLPQIEKYFKTSP